MTAVDPAWSNASRKESLGTSGIVLALVGLEVFLLAWWIALGPPVNRWVDLLDPGLLRPLGFVSACSAALLITQTERYVERLGRTPWRRAAAWLVTVIALVNLALALGSWILLMAVPQPPTSLCRAAAVSIALALTLALPTVALRRRLRRREPSTVPDPVTATSVAAGRTGMPPTPTVAFSGGGIRAATFALGAWNALSSRHADVACASVGPDHSHDVECGARAPRLVAVSGGSYLAAAIALVRRWKVSGQHAAVREGRDILPWHQVYGVTSPEAQRLRRHSRDLVEPRSQLLGGALTLVTGSVLNVVVMLSFGWFGAWLLAWLHVAAGSLRTESAAEGGSPAPASSTLHLALPALPPDGWSDAAWWLCWGVPAVLLVITAGLFLVHLVVLHRIDARGREPERRRRIAAWRVPVLGLALAYLAVSVGVPGLLYTLNRLAVSNAPTPVVASTLEKLGFADDAFCRAGADSSLTRASAAVNARARLNLGVPQAAQAGSCGSTYTVTATYDEIDTEPVDPSQLETMVEELVTSTAPDPGVDVAAATTALVTLVTTLLLAVGRANATADASSLTGWRARLRRVFTSWLPFVALTVTMSWLLLSWTFSLILKGADPVGAGPAAWVAAGLLLSLLLNANLTAVHSYYRHRLSSAFAVGRTPAEVATELPYGTAYSYSALGDVPLHVVTTANVHAYDEVPSRRGGLPLVFGPDGVRLVTKKGETVVPVADFERSAGLGRVSIMTTVATSGAAVSPMAGRFSYTLAPFRILLTLFNVRVGTWVPNPLWGNRSTDRGWPRPWLIARPGAAQVFAEAIGKSSTQDRWLYLSDGGHLDNTGLVEAVRLHRTPGGYAGRIVVIDASNDPKGSWSAVGDALGVVRAEMGLDLRCVLDETTAATPQEPADPTSMDGPVQRVQRAWAELTGRAAPEDHSRPYLRVYESDAGGDLLELMVVKAVRPAADAPGLPESVRSFAARTLDFPRSSTARQDFGDIEFEAYRALGEYYTALAWDRWSEHRRARST